VTSSRIAQQKACHLRSTEKEGSRPAIRDFADAGSSPAHMAQGACVLLRDFDPDPPSKPQRTRRERVVWERIGAWPPGDLCRSSHLCG
jgi:hypothetical protein